MLSWGFLFTLNYKRLLILSIFSFIPNEFVNVLANAAINGSGVISPEPELDSDDATLDTVDNVLPNLESEFVDDAVAGTSSDVSPELFDTCK